MKEVNPNASWLMRQWANKSLDVQAAGLRKLDDMAPRFVYQDGKLVVEHVGDTIPGESSLLKAFYSDPLFRRSYLRGSWRLGTPFNDIRPRNMGRNGKIFDPVKHPLHEGFDALKWELGVTFVRLGDRYYMIIAAQDELAKPIVPLKK